LLTNPGERVFSTEYGAGLRKYVFEQISRGTGAEIQNYIESLITKYFPDIKPQVSVAASSDYNTIYITVNYSVVTTGINDTVQISLNNGWK